MKNQLMLKYEKLEHIIKNYESLLVAFSGGVDSTFLLAVAGKVLGGKVLGVTVDTPFFTRQELGEARSIARGLGVAHEVLTLDSFDDEYVVSNTKDRCYYCKKGIIEALTPMGAARHINIIAHGANVDDQGDYRPGQRAASEMGVVAPLMDAGLAKVEIRSLSREMGLETWDKPAMACLATRIPYGTAITREALQMVEQAETVLRRHGFINCRVRHYGRMARIEVPTDTLARVLEEGTRRDIVEQFRSLGYLHIALDLEGYATGRMNRDL